jgi:thiamine-phosphate pyrophosphorylase
MERVILRILDANLDRAREGLRVIEEWCRFGLADTHLTSTCKNLRQELGRWHSDAMRSARDTPGDPGTDLTHPQEASRSDIHQVLAANLARIQESLRVLEEYGKISQPELASAVKQIRYQVYTLESQLLHRWSTTDRRSSQLQRLTDARLYLVTSPEPNLVAIVAAALEGGLRLVQYRDKNADNGARLENARQLKALCQKYNAVFIVNDHIDLALAVDADGVHLGQQDYPMEVARRLLGSDKIIGRSTTNPAEMQRAIDEKADYIGVGPVYETPTKAGKSAAGHEYVRYAATHAPMPWYAIGGIDATNIDSVLEAGAQGVSVVRAIMQAPDPAVITCELVAKLAAR